MAEAKHSEQLLSLDLLNVIGELDGAYDVWAKETGIPPNAREFSHGIAECTKFRIKNAGWMVCYFTLIYYECCMRVAMCLCLSDW
jgi:hypothetical protein